MSCGPGVLVSRVSGQWLHRVCRLVGGVADILLDCLRAPGQGANTPLKNAAIASGASSGVTAATY